MTRQRYPGDPVRPRFGMVHRTDGVSEPVIYEVTENPLVFNAVLVSDGTEVVLTMGDRLTVDVLAPGQSVTMGAPSSLRGAPVGGYSIAEPRGHRARRSASGVLPPLKTAMATLAVAALIMLCGVTAFVVWWWVFHG